MSFRRLVKAIVFLAIFTMAMRISAGNDTFWHLRAGEWMLEHGRLLGTDPFSLTRAGSAWIYPGWLAQIAMALAQRALGFPGLNLLTALMVLLAFLAIWPVTEGSPLTRGFLMILAAAASGVYWSARPQIFSFALSGVFLLLLERARKGEGRSYWLAPGVMALWVNLHGGFAIGFLMLIAYLAGEGTAILLQASRLGWDQAWREHRDGLRRFGALFAASIVAVGFNPHGYRMLAYPFKTVSIGVLQDYIQEWQSPDFHRLEVQPFLWLVILAWPILAASKADLKAHEFYLLAGFAMLGFMAGRNIATFALVTPVIYSRHLATFLGMDSNGQEAGGPSRRRLHLAVFLLLLAAAGLKISIPLSANANQEALAKKMPVAAVGAIQEARPPANLFNSYNWGGFVIWTLYPGYRSFVDGRTDLFDDEILESYLDAWRGEPSWRDLFQRWDLHTALIEPWAPLRWQLEGAGWEAIYADEQAIVLIDPDAARFSYSGQESWCEKAHDD